MSDRRLGNFSPKLDHFGGTNNCYSLQVSASSTTNTVVKLANSLSLFTHLFKKISCLVLFIPVPLYPFPGLVLIFSCSAEQVGVFPLCSS